MMKTDEVIERLATGVEPVTPLRRPWLRAAGWFGATLVYAAVLAVMTALLNGAPASFEIRFLVPQLAAIAVSGAAALAAFGSVVPGVSARVVTWPVLAGLVWVAVLLVSAVQEWRALGPVDLFPRREWICVVTIAVGGALPALGMTRMLRRGAPLTPRATTALAVLGGVGVANVAACASHPAASSAVVLVCHGMTIVALVAVGAWLGRSALSWNSVGH